LAGNSRRETGERGAEGVPQRGRGGAVGVLDAGWLPREGSSGRMGAATRSSSDLLKSRHDSSPPSSPAAARGGRRPAELLPGGAGYAGCREGGHVDGSEIGTDPGCESGVCTARELRACERGVPTVERGVAGAARGEARGDAEALSAGEYS